MSISAALNIARRYGDKYASGGAVNTDPSPAQKDAGNYKMRHIVFQGIPISIENPKGTIRSGLDHNGKPWSTRMTEDYGYIKRTEGHDGDQVDVFVGPNKRSQRVWIIDQLHHHMRKFDEHKCMLGFDTEKQAMHAYHKSYGRVYGASHTVGGLTELSIDAFKEWLKGGGGKEPMAPDVPKFQAGGAVDDQPPIEDVPGVGPVPTTIPEPISQAAKAYSETPSWLEQAQQQTERGIEAYQRSGVKGLLAETEPTQELAGGFGGTTVGSLAKVAPKFATAMGKIAFDLHPDEVAAAKPITGTMGTSEGGMYTGFSDGINRYVKKAKSLEHAKDEVLAGKLYELAGVPVGKTELTQLHGKPAVASQVIPGAQQLSEFEPHQYPNITGIQEHFPADAWLANWDWPGVGIENPKGNILVDSKNQAHRIDFGGALRFRGLGGEKGDLFGPKVGELNTLRNPSMNPISSELLEGVTLDPANPTANRIANISSPQIAELVDKYGPASKAENLAMRNKLIARRDDLAKQYGIEPGTAAPPAPPVSTPVAKDEGYIPYKLENPAEDVASLLKNHEYGGGTPQATGEYDVPGIASDMYRMAFTDPNFVDQVYKMLPEDIGGDVNAELSQLIESKGFDPWSALTTPPEGRAIAEPEPKVGTVYKPQPHQVVVPKIMQINKSHTPEQVVHALKDMNYMAAASDPKLVTPKQLAKIGTIINAKPAKGLANHMFDLDDAQKTNLYSWMNQKQVDAVGDELHTLNSTKDLVTNNDHYDQLIENQKKHQENLAQGVGASFQPAAPSIIKPKGSFTPQLYYDALAPINWLEHKPSISKFGPIKSKYLDFINANKAPRGKMLAAGFNPDVPLFKGGTKYLMGHYPSELVDPKTYPTHSEKAFFLAAHPTPASGYAGVGMINPYFGRAPKAFEAWWEHVSPENDFYNSYNMKHLISAGHDIGADLLIVRNVRDVTGHGAAQYDQYLFLNTAGLRHPGAAFDPKKLSLRYPMAGLVGGGVFGYGMLRGEEQKQGQEYAAGGRVGVSKIDRDAFLYMNPKPPKDSFAQCGTCLMFTGTGCTILGKTKITKDMTCGLYVRGKPQYNLRGKEQDLVTPKEAGLVNFQVRCENCRYGGEDCQLFEKLNEEMPETFDLDTKIDSKGCCNAFTKKGA